MNDAVFIITHKRADEQLTLRTLQSLNCSLPIYLIVDDLDQLKKGGRVSAVAATFGKALQIKPLLSCDETGKLVNVGKIRGKSNVIPTLEANGLDFQYGDNLITWYSMLFFNE